MIDIYALYTGLHFSVEELLLYPSVGVHVSVSVRVDMWNVNANVKVLEFQLVFFFNANFVYNTNKAPYNNSSQQLPIQWLLHLW